MITATQLKQKIRHLAAQKEMDPQLLQRAFVMEQFLFLLGLTKHKDNFIIKGGFLIRSLLGVEKRTTMDIDTTVKGFTLNRENLAAIFNEICSANTFGGISFRVEKIEEIREEDDYPGFRVSMIATIQTMGVPFKVDLTTGDAITPKEELTKYTSILDDKEIELWSYPIETVLAEKLQTVLYRTTLSTRARDYYDIHMLYLLKKDEINWKALNESLQATMIKRETVDLLDDYSSVLILIEADDNLQKLWIRYQDKNSYVGNISFNETIQSVKAVLDRIILSV